MTWDFVGIDTLFRVVIYWIVPLLAGMMLIRKLAAFDAQAAAREGRPAKLAAVLAGAKTVPILRRPAYRPRWRFPFRTLRSASLWVILTVVASRSRVRCTPEPRPVPTIIDCARDDSRLARIGCALAAAALTETVEKFRR